MKSEKETMNNEKQVPGRGLLRKISRTLLCEENE